LENAGRNRFQLSRGFCLRPARFEACDGGQPPPVPAIEDAALPQDQRLGAEGNSYVKGTAHFHAEEAGRSHAHDLEGVALEPKRAADGGGLCSILALPERVADHSARGATAVLVAGCAKKASPHRLHSEHIEEISTYVHTARPACLTTRCQIERCVAPGEDAGKSLLLVAYLFP